MLYNGNKQIQRNEDGSHSLKGGVIMKYIRKTIIKVIILVTVLLIIFAIKAK